MFECAVPKPIESILETRAIGDEKLPLTNVKDGLRLRRQALLHLSLEATQHERTKNSVQLVNHLLLRLLIINLQIEPLFSVINRTCSWYTGMDWVFPWMTYVDIKLCCSRPGEHTDMIRRST